MEVNKLQAFKDAVIQFGIVLLIIVLIGFCVGFGAIFLSSHIPINALTISIVVFLVCALFIWLMYKDNLEEQELIIMEYGADNGNNQQGNSSK